VTDALGTDVPHELAPTVTYPLAERLDLVENVHGHRVADPYRWLEDPSDPRTQAWTAEQDQLARHWLETLPGREHLAGRVGELLQAGSVSVPIWRASRAFFARRAPGQEHAVLHVRNSDGTERMLLDVTALDPGGLTTLDGWTPSREGHRLAYLLSTGGDEESRLYVMDVTSGELLEGPIERAKYASIAWLPGGDEFFSVRRLPPEQVPAGEEQFHRRVWRHRVAPTLTPPASRAVVCSAPLLDMARYEEFLIGRIRNDEYDTARCAPPNSTRRPATRPRCRCCGAGRPKSGTALARSRARSRCWWLAFIAQATGLDLRP
jgi:prolyl oligopeptidase PreP (S9A serine peptidase family)